MIEKNGKFRIPSKEYLLPILFSILAKKVTTANIEDIGAMLAFP